jgi:O-antigen/teichoic acid export membrane protein
MLARAVPFFLGVFGLTVLVNADIIGLKVLAPAAVADRLAGHYQAAVTLARIPVFMAQALFAAVFPFIARRAVRSDLARAYARLALKYTLLFIVPVDVVFLAAPGAALRTFFSDAFADSALPLAAAASGTIAVTLVHALAMLLQAGGRARIPAVWVPLAAVAQVAALVWLVPAFGTVGAALSLLVAGTVALAGLTVPALRTFGVHLEWRPSVAYLLALVALTLPLALGPQDGRLAALGTMALAGVTYLLALLLLGLITSEDVRIGAGALGPRWTAGVEGTQRLVGALNRLPPRGYTARPAAVAVEVAGAKAAAASETAG